MKKVIDAETMTCLETFEESQYEQIKEKYENMNRWDDVNFDNDGDLILWKDL